ncbi:MAG: hypothetical protein S4CHLAM20_08570 [Chlamydiia bacterium]|nr:hypothetical protein [Chlamydiia bacterium]
MTHDCKINRNEQSLKLVLPSFDTPLLRRINDSISSTPMPSQFPQIENVISIDNISENPKVSKTLAQQNRLQTDFHEALDVNLKQFKIRLQEFINEKQSEKDLPKEEISKVAFLVSFMETFDEIKKELHVFVDEIGMDNRKHLHAAFLAQRASERACQKSDENKSIWDTVANSIGGIMGVVSICIGITLLSSGNPLGVIAGVGLILSGLASVAAVIMEKLDIKNEYTMGVQIFGGIIGLISGGLSIAMSADKMALIMRLGIALLSAAKHSSDIISSYYQKESLEHQARSTHYNKDLEMDRDVIKQAFKTLDRIEHEDLESKIQFIQALKYEQRIYENINKKVAAG